MLITRKKFLISVLFASVLPGCTTTSPMRRPEYEQHDFSSPQKVYYAGVSVVGDYKDNEANVPYASSMLAELDAVMLDKIQRQKGNFRYLDLKTGELGRVDSSDALAFSLGIDLESVVAHPWIDGRFKVVFDVYAQLIFFDYAEKKIVRSVPVNYQYITLMDHMPTEEDSRMIFKGIYAGGLDGLGKGLVEAAVEKLLELKVKSSYRAYLKVGNVDVEDKAIKTLSKFKKSKTQYESLIAQLLSKSIVDNTGAAVVPYTPGQAIGAKMIGRFSNGLQYSFVMPDPDYVIDIELKSLKKARDTKSSSKIDVEVYLAFMRLKVRQPDLGKTYMDQLYRATGRAELVKGQKAELEAAYTETIMGFFEGFSKNLFEIDDEWIERSVPPKARSRAELELERTSKAVEMCF